MNTDPKVASLDIETFGATHGHTQTTFSVPRMRHVDGHPTRDIVHCVSLTLPTSDPGTRPWTIEALASLHPGPSMVFDLRIPRHLRMFSAWVRHLDTFLTMNGAFDLGVLLACYPSLRMGPLSHTVVDLAVVNHWESDVRPERSLKSITPLSGFKGYDVTAKDKFRSWGSLADYCALDTTNTMAVISNLSSRMVGLRSCPTPELIDLYSQTLWSTVAMTNNGVPYHRPSMEAEHTRLSRRNALIRRHLELVHGFRLTGPGSKTHRMEFLYRCVSKIDAASTTSSNSSSGVSSEVSSATPQPPLSTNCNGSKNSNRESVLSMLELTPARKEPSFNETNRRTLLNRLPSDSPEAHILRMIEIHEKQQKLLGSYLQPMLYHRSNRPSDRTSILVPPPRPHRRRHR